MMNIDFCYLRPRQMRELLGLSRSRIEAMVKEGRLPAPYRLGKRAIAWRSDEVEEACQGFERRERLHAQDDDDDDDIVMVRTKFPGEERGTKSPPVGRGALAT